MKTEIEIWKNYRASLDQSDENWTRTMSMAQEHEWEELELFALARLTENEVQRAYIDMKIEELEAACS